jgi:hypothetical protein
MMPGWWDVPNNPVAAQRGVTYVPGIGDILPALFTQPENPILNYVRGQVKPLATSGTAAGGLNAPPGMGHLDCGCGCGGSGSCGHSHGGLGAISQDLANMATDIGGGQWTQFGNDFIALITEPTIAGIPLWAFGIGIFFLIRMVSSHEVTLQRRS